MKKRLIWIRRILFYFTLIAAIITLFRFFTVDDQEVRGEMLYNLVMYFITFIIFLAPRILKKGANIIVPTELHVLIAMLAFGALVLGDTQSFYSIYPWWDSFLHFIGGIILSLTGYWIIKLIMQEKSEYIYLNKVFTVIFVICFSLAAGAVWEIWEYSYDEVLGENSQRHSIVVEDPTLGKQYVGKVGHDALNDTMKDLMLDLGGSIVACTYGTIKINHDEKKQKEDMIE